MAQQPHQLQYRWPPELIAILRQGFADGLSMSQITKNVGPPYTRNAVIGKCHRLGLRFSPDEVTRRKATRGNIMAAAASKPRRTRRQTLADTHMRDAFDRRAVLDTVIERDGLRDLPPDQSPHAVPLLEVKDRQCRWPLNDAGPGFLFCGDKVFACSYCARHYLMAHRYTPPAQRPPRQHYGTVRTYGPGAETEHVDQAVGRL